MIFYEKINKIWNYDHYWDTGFILAFLLSSLMGFLLNYSTMLCTNYNSALTTTVVGACKVCFVRFFFMINSTNLNFKESVCNLFWNGYRWRLSIFHC